MCILFLNVILLQIEYSCKNLHFPQNFLLTKTVEVGNLTMSLLPKHSNSIHSNHCIRVSYTLISLNTNAFAINSEIFNVYYKLMIFVQFAIIQTLIYFILAQRIIICIFLIHGKQLQRMWLH